MKRVGTSGREWIAGALLAASLGMVGCTQAPELAVVQSERTKTVLRFDSFQSAASNGKALAAGTAGGVIVTSTDAGKSWHRTTLAPPSSVVAMTACPDGTFAGLDFYRKVWIGDANAMQWKARAITTKINPLAITCDGLNRLWVAGSYTGILSSADKGLSWNATTLGGDAILTTVQFVDERRGMVSGEFGLFATTADGGASWQKQAKIADDFYPYATLFTDAQHGWSSGLAGALLHTADGGGTWVKQTNPSGASMYALVKLGADLFGLGAGGQMIVLRGSEWARFDRSPTVPAYLAAGAPLDASSMLLAGAAGALQVVSVTTAASVAPVPGSLSR